MYCVADIVGFVEPCAMAESFLISEGLTQLTTSALAPKSMVVPSAFAGFDETFV
jgi:hypothetical protein